MQDVVAATYFAFNQMDCDGQTGPGDAGCGVVSLTGKYGAIDELQDLNRSPRLEKITIDDKGFVTVNLAVFFAGTIGWAPATYFYVHFSPQGTFLYGE